MSTAGKQEELGKLLREAAALHARIATVASELTAEIVREAMVAALGQEPKREAAPLKA